MATHKKNHTLDLIITRSNNELVGKPWLLDPQISDHFAVNCKLMITKQPFPKKLIISRNLKKIDAVQFKHDITNSGLLEGLYDSNSSVSEMVESYEEILLSVLNKHAPVRSKVIILRPAAPWLTSDIRKQKRERRRLERKWRSTGLTVHREMYAKQSSFVNNLISSAKKAYYADQISSCGSDQYQLFKIVESLNKGTSEKNFPPSGSADDLANDFADFFKDKINGIRKHLVRKCIILRDPMPAQILPQVNTLDSFTCVTCEELAPLVKRYLPSRAV